MRRSCVLLRFIRLPSSGSALVAALDLVTFRSESFSEKGRGNTASVKFYASNTRSAAFLLRSELLARLSRRAERIIDPWN